MATRRGTTNSNSRGNSKDRKARKLWLLTEFGDGDSAPCSFECGALLTLDTVSVDRYPVPGIEGGTYCRGNIRPACQKCNSADGARIGIERSAERKGKQLESKDEHTAEEQVRAVQGWMALDLHMALGHEIDHGSANQGFHSWADWWSSLCAEVRQLDAYDRRPLDI